VSTPLSSVRIFRFNDGTSTHLFKDAKGLTIYGVVFDEDGHSTSYSRSEAVAHAMNKNLEVGLSSPTEHRYFSEVS